jgi:hypothetical protein
MPAVEVDAAGTAGAASERIAVDAEPFTADVPIVAVGFANVTPTPLHPDPAFDRSEQEGWRNVGARGPPDVGPIKAV